MTNDPGQPLVIKEWANAMGNSPNVGIGLIRNCNIDTELGAVSPQYAPAAISPTPSSTTFTAVAATDLCTLGGAFAALADNVAVQLTTTGSLPGGLSTGTNYFIIKKSATTFKLATCIKNVGKGNSTGFSESAINITDSGTGVHTITTVNVGNIGGIATIMEPDLFINSLPLRLTFYTDDNGRVWFYDPYHYGTLTSISTVPDQLLLLDGNSLSGPKGKGIGAFQTANINRRYIFTYRTLEMDVCDVRSIDYMCDPVGNSAWTTSWQSVTGQNDASQHTIVGQDNIMYFCNGKTIGSLQELPTKTFAPGDSSTYTFNQSALTLPQGEISFWLEELGVSLLVAGGSFNNIYPWDRSSPSFDLPIKCAETGVYRLKNINNTIYILNGIRGNIYKTQGAIVGFAARLPEYAVGNGGARAADGSVSPVQWGGEGAKNGNLLFGVSTPNNTANQGVWMLYPDGRLVLDNQPSTGAAIVTAIDERRSEFYTFAYSGGVDLVGSTRYGSYGAVVQSALYPVGSKTSKANFSQLELQLAQPCTTAGYNIRVSYRTGISGSFTTLATFTTDGTTFSFTSDIGITDIENIQIQIELSGSGNNGDALLLFEVRLYP